MTGRPDPEEVRVYNGADPRTWPQEERRLWGAMLDIEVLNRVIAALDGPVGDADVRFCDAAHEFLERGLRAQRGLLSELVLGAYEVVLPDEPASPATEAVGGSSGDGDGPGDRDHM